MQSKSSRGVQQEDVWGAADALIAEGLRPTIERVRQKMGRGSPNTVSPMLETWFASLGKRLGMRSDEAIDGQMPPVAAQAMAKLWNAALEAARKEATASLTLENQALDAANAALAERESNLTQQEQAFAQRQGVLDALLQAEREKTASVEAGLAAAREQVRQRDVAVVELQKAVSTAEKQLQTARAQSDEQARQHTVERGKLEERAAGNERRLLAEIDRERLLSKQGNAAADEASALLQTLRASFETRTVTLGHQLHASEMELGIARHALEISERRCTELSALLQEQRGSSTEAFEKLNLTIAALTLKSAPAKRKTTAGGRK